MSYAWKGFHSWGSSFGPSFGPGITSGAILPIASWDASTSTLAQLAVLASHSRTSLATMFDSAGKLTYAPNNLLTYSNNFSDASWTKSNISVGTGVPDPVGGANAFTLTATAANAFIFKSIAVGAQKGINSIWMKRRTGSGVIRLYGFDNVAQPVTGQVTGSWTQVYTSPAIGNGTGFSFEVDIVSSGDAIDVYLGVAASVTYETTPRTADQVITTASAFYGPRVDYTYFSTPGLLDETSSRTNYTLYGTTLASNWTARGFSTSAGVTGPDGSTPLVRIAVNASGSQDFYQITTGLPSAARYEPSFWISRVSTSGTLRIINPALGPSFGDWSINLATIGAGLVRITRSTPGVTVNNEFATTGTSGGVQFYASAGGPLTVDIGFIQQENGTTSTSYIPTAASTVTRAADALTAASLTTNPAIIQKRDLATGVRSRKVINPWSGISSETDEWIEAIRVYPSGTSGTYLNTKLTVDGPW